MMNRHRDNIRCTLQEEKADQYEVEAWEAFDAEIVKLIQIEMIENSLK